MTAVMAGEGPPSTTSCVATNEVVAGEGPPSTTSCVVTNEVVDTGRSLPPGTGPGGWHGRRRAVAGKHPRSHPWRRIAGGWTAMRIGGSLSRTLGHVVLVTILLLGPAFAAADTVAVTVRSGNHPDYGRIVFDAPPGVTYRVVRDGDRLTVQFAGDVALAGDPKLPRNVAALHADGTQAVLTVAAGATFHAARLGDHVVIDVFDPASAGHDAAPEPPPPASRPPSPPATSASPPATSAAAPAARPSTAPSPAPASAPAAATPVPAPSSAPVPARSKTGPPARPAADATARAPRQSAPPPKSPAAPAKQITAPPQPAAATVKPPSAAAKPLADAALPPTPAPMSTVAPVSKVTPVPAAAPATMPPPVAPPAAAAAPPSGSTAPIAPAVVSAPPATAPAVSASGVLALPFSTDVGAAVFHRGGETLLVFDDRRQIDMSALQSTPGLAGARAELLPAATLIRVTPSSGTVVSLAKTPQGWTVAALTAPPQPLSLRPRPSDAVLSVAAREPGGVLAIADTVTGGTLLVGTQRQPGQAMLAQRDTAQFTLLPTLQGIVVVPLADTVVLRTVPSGFALTTAPDPLALSRGEVESLGDVTALTRRFDFPALPPDQLLRQLSGEIADAAAEPLLARGPGRRAAANTMISLGMDAEAEALLQMIAEDDPRQAASADVAGLTAIAAMLAGRLSDADGIDDARLTGTDEIVLWRALHVAMRDANSPYAAVALVSAAPLLLTYPPAIRDKLLPLALETMVRGGAASTAAALLSRAQDVPGLDMARAMLAQATGDTAAALAGYDALAAGHDQLLRARAAVRAVDLRLTIGKLDARQAAEALDRLLFAWRGDKRELDLRNKLADLRQQLGEWRPALALLRDSEAAFPDDAKAIHARLLACFDALLHDDAADKLPPLEFVALVDENADLVPNTGEGAAMQAALADKLLALDLPNRAGPVLDKLMRASPAGPARATFGGRLAKLRMGEADAEGALAALAASDAAGLPAPLNEQRVMLRADALAHRGDVAGAIAALSGLDSAAAVAARAGILEQAQDWAGADQALASYVAKTVPDTGDLDDAARRLLLRLATAAARAGDEATLVTLRQQQEARMGSGPLADMFHLLTEDPVHGTADLVRAGREVGYARALPRDLQTMQP
jgi:hypothetical protein